MTTNKKKILRLLDTLILVWLVGTAVISFLLLALLFIHYMSDGW